MASQDLFQELVSSSHFDLAFNELDKNGQDSEENLASVFCLDRSGLLAEVHLFYQQGSFCDLKLVSGHVDLGVNCINCHAIVLSAALPQLHSMLDWAFQTSDDDKYARLYLPDFQLQDLKTFVDSIYSSMSSTDSTNILVPRALAQALGLNVQQNNVILVENNDTLPIRKSTRHRKKVVNDDDEDISMPDISPAECDQTPVKVRVNSPAAEEELSPLYLKSLEPMKEEQLSISNIAPYSWLLSEPSLFSSAQELQKLLESFSASGTVIHASTGDPFHYTQEVGEERGYLQGSACYPNSKFKKLIRVPDTTIFAVVAVGIRHLDNSTLNILQPLAVRSWPVKVIFDNLVEMLLNVAGISRYQLVSSDRYYKFKRVKSQKPNRIGRAMQSLKKLSPEQLESLRHKTSEEMQELQKDRVRGPFAHLPVIPAKIQFAFVDQISDHERTDYAVLYGDQISQLHLKSFVNFQARDFSPEDWIAIFLDLIVALTGIENPLVLRNQKDLFEPMDQLLFRHQAFELLNDPLKRYCIPCRTIFPFDSEAERTAYQLHAQEHCIKKEDSAGLLSCTGSVKCSKLFQSKEALEEHVAKSHDKSVKGDGSYCDTCGKFLPNVYRLKKHHDAHHRQIKCKVCGSFFSGTIGLASHRDREHSQKLPCPHCHKLLASRVKLEYHMISHMAPEEKKYICEKCGKRFGWSHHLAKHEMNVHVRSRPYKCSVSGCNWAFNDLSNRNMHERRVHKLGPPPKR